MLNESITREDVQAALERIASGNADQDDLNCIKSELARLWRLSDADADDDIDFRPWVAMLNAAVGTTVTGGTPPCTD